DAAAHARADAEVARRELERERQALAEIDGKGLEAQAHERAATRDRLTRDIDAAADVDARLEGYGLAGAEALRSAVQESAREEATCEEAQKGLAGLESQAREKLEQVEEAGKEARALAVELGLPGGSPGAWPEAARGEREALAAEAGARP